MKVFKFGGASIRDARSVRNLLKVLEHFAHQELVIVVSAMGKTTNALEQVVQLHYEQSGEPQKALQELESQHLDLLAELIPEAAAPVYREVQDLFAQLRAILDSPPEGHYNQVYDRIVSFGELVSTKIISHFLALSGYQNRWLDARRLIRTDQNYRFARVDWNFTGRLLREIIEPGHSYVIQGFIGSDSDMQSTTLGREGSDYTASVIAYLLEAEEVSIWKDVPGVLNGDPKVFQNSVLLEAISYREAIELAFYGASVIHPKTIQPLQRKEIPLRVRSFMDPGQPGTRIGKGQDLQPRVPCFIRKENQILLTLATRDLAFIVEDHLSVIYKVFHQFGVRVNMSQNSAVSSSFCINDDPVTTPRLIEELQGDFEVSYNQGVQLYTVRHYDEPARQRVRSTGQVLLEQISRETYQVVVQSETVTTS